MTNEEKIRIFEEIPPAKAAWNQMLPAITSQMVILIYNLTDTFFVGMLNSPVQSSALQVVYPAFTFLNAISNLFGVGGAVLVSRAMGKRDRQAGKEASQAAFWWGVLTSLVLVFGFFLGRSWILRLCGATEENYDPVVQYALFVLVIGGPFTVAGNVMGNLVRAQGDAVKASFGISSGAILNIVLDPFFVLPQFLNQGVKGAGEATFLSNGFTAAYFLLFLLKRSRRGDLYISIGMSHLKDTGKWIRQVLALGLPSAALNALAVISVAAQTKFVSKYTVEAVAALGIIKKLDMLPLYFALGCGSGMLPILTYNYSTGNKRRFHDIFRFGLRVSIGFCTFCLIVFELFAPALTGLFIDDGETIRLASGFIRRMVIAMPMMAFCNPVVVLFQSIGDSKRATLISVLRKGVLDIPLLFLWDGLIPLYGCMWVQPTVDAIAMITAGILYRGLLRREPELCRKR